MSAAVLRSPCRVVGAATARSPLPPSCAMALSLALFLPDEDEIRRRASLPSLLDGDRATTWGGSGGAAARGEAGAVIGPRRGGSAGQRQGHGMRQRQRGHGTGEGAGATWLRTARKEGHVRRGVTSEPARSRAELRPMRSDEEDSAMGERKKTGKMPRFQPENLGKNVKVFERVTEMAKRKGCTPSQLALAWVHHQGRDVCPIPGTTKIENFKQNVGALSVKLTQDEMAELESFAAAGIVQGDRHFQMNSTWKNSETPPLSLSSRKYDLDA